MLDMSAAVADRGVDVAMHVEEGETVALLGPNGAGKSTVLALVAGLLRPTRGHVALDGRRLTDVDARRPMVPPHRREVALLAQDALLFPHLSSLDNVAFGPRARRTSRHRARELARGWLAEVGVADLAARRPAELSGGQAQRVALARALAADPRLLLLDEPMAALDVDVRPELRQTLREALAGRSVLMVTHDVLDALLLADRVVVLEQGHVVEEGATAQVLTSPRSRFAARIAGLNAVAGTWRDQVVHATDGRVVSGEVSGPRPRPGEPVVAVFRPAAVSVYVEPPGGSPRNLLSVVVAGLEPQGDRVRVRAGDLSADVTPAAVAELGLGPGREVFFSVKATEVAIYRT